MSSIKVEPLVSVLTPVYNGGIYFADCIESVLRQTYKNFEYIIVNNCSTDHTLRIARNYAEKDQRITVYDNDQFLDVISNHNAAFNKISDDSKYCKVVSADDIILENCIEKMVHLAEQNPTLAIVGSLQIREKSIKWQGFHYPRQVFSGREVGRAVFLSCDPQFGFGDPTSLLFRSSIVRKNDHFFPNLSLHADTSACFNVLKEHDYGFVYQILSYGRTHKDSMSSKGLDINSYTPAYLNDVLNYGRHYLDEFEYQKILNKTLSRYYRYLAFRMFDIKDENFWNYHRKKLSAHGYSVSRKILIKSFIINIVKEFLKPYQALKKIGTHLKKTHGA